MLELIILITIFGFIFGAIFGSFINAAVYRMKEKVSIVTERSFCPNCKVQIKSYDLIPIFSYIILRGKCRNCKKRISPHYPIIEFMTAVFSAFLAYHFITFRISSFEFIVLFILIVNMMFIFSSDILYKEIFNQNQIVNILGAIALVVLRDNSIFYSFMSGVIAAGLFYMLFRFTGEENIGFGDVKLVFGIGFLFQFFTFIYIIFFSALLGIIIGYIMSKVTGKELKKVQVPLGSVISLLSIIFLILENFIYLDIFLKLEEISFVF